MFFYLKHPIFLYKQKQFPLYMVSFWSSNYFSAKGIGNGMSKEKKAYDDKDECDNIQIYPETLKNISSGSNNISTLQRKNCSSEEKTRRKATFDESKNKEYYYNTYMCDYFYMPPKPQKKINQEEIVEEKITVEEKKPFVFEEIPEPPKEIVDDSLNKQKEVKQTKLLTDSFSNVDANEPCIKSQQMDERKIINQVTDANELGKINTFFKPAPYNNFYKNLNIFKKLLNVKIVATSTPEVTLNKQKDICNRLGSLSVGRHTKFNTAENNRKQAKCGKRKLEDDNKLKTNPFLVFDACTDNTMPEYAVDDIKKSMFNKQS